MAKRVMLGMSGGVDSSVAALLLQEQGYDVVGVTMKLRPDEFMTGSLAGGCCSLDDVADARKVANRLGIPHYVLNFTDIFTRKVIDYFVEEYSLGRTPNPCIACNRFVKFQALLEKALSMEFDFVATGHYAIIERPSEEGRWLLKKSPSEKDQSYVLYSLTQQQLAHTLMPLGGYSKPKARALAEAHELPVAHKPDSQEICFVEDNDYAGFIERYSGKKSVPGNFVDQDGKILGRHKGITHYTIGQRKGLGISFGQPMFVTGISAGDNTVVLGKEGSQYRRELLAEDCNWIAVEGLREEVRVTAKVRYQAKPAEALLVPMENGRVHVVFEEPQRSVTPGQAVVFYQGSYVLGGGTISSFV